MCRGVSKKEAFERALPFIKLVGLAGFEQKYPYQLSGGMQQRANLARALTVDPELLLMDEPFAALDAQTRELMQVELIRIWTQARKTVIFITHQIDEAIFLSDRVVVMSARPGTIIADITIDLPRPRDLDLKRTPEFVAYEDQIWRLIAKQLGPEAVAQA
jgi:NitT/TauT family transport system ATP-binding protein